MHIAHQFLFRELSARPKKPFHFGSVVLEQVVEGNCQRIGGSENLDFRNEAHLVMLDGLPAPVADMSNHGSRITGLMPARESHETLHS